MNNGKPLIVGKHFTVGDRITDTSLLDPRLVDLFAEDVDVSQWGEHPAIWELEVGNE